MQERFIVAEISKNWPEEDMPGGPRFLGQRFEAVINRNWARGYSLHSWHVNRIWRSADELNETIIAVFEWKEHHQSPPEIIDDDEIPDDFIV